MGPGVPNVLIGKLPAAVVGDTATCVGPPDAIVKGSMGVMISGRPAARMGDTTAHGGSIALGCPNVLIGDASPGAPPVVIVPPFPGSVQARSSSSGQQGQSEKPEPAKTEPKKAPEKEKPVYSAEFELVGEDGKGVAMEKFRVTLPDGSVREGVTDLQGKIKIDDIETQGSCKISFPELDQDCWEDA